MYVCLHPVLYNSNHKHVGTISCLLEAKDKMKQFRYSVHVYKKRIIKHNAQGSLDHYMCISFWARTAHLHVPLY